MATWPVQEAKARLSEVIEQAERDGPQIISRHGTDRVVVVAIDDYRVLVAQRPDFKAYLLGGPKVADFTTDRERDSGRAVEW